MNEDVQHLEIDDWIWQAEQDASASSKEPLLLIKINRRKPFVLFPMKLLEGEEPKITYGKYVIMRFDYFLKKDTSFFFRSNVLT